MKKVAAIGAGVIALALVGGGVAIATNQDEASISTEPAISPSADPLPITASEPAKDDSEDTDALFVEYVRSELTLLPSTGIAHATDEELITAAHDGCEQLIAGVDPETIRLVEGEEATSGGYFSDTGAIIDGARRFYCPETIF